MKNSSSTTPERGKRKFDKKAIMKLAWHIYETTGTYTLSQAIKQAWECHKDDF